MTEFLFLVVIGLAIWIGVIGSRALQRDRDLIKEIRSLREKVYLLELEWKTKQESMEREVDSRKKILTPSVEEKDVTQVVVETNENHEGQEQETPELPKLQEKTPREVINSKPENTISEQKQECEPASTPVDFAAEPKKKKSRTRNEWEMLIGGKLLNRIGALAIIFGMIFLFKLAIDYNWITETAQVCFGYLVTAIFTWIGVRTHKKGLPIFAQGILGTAVAVAYTTSFAAYEFYDLVPMMVGFGLMSIVTIGAFWIAIRYASLAIALLGWLGGFVTPFLIQSDHGSTIGLFSYLGTLTIGVLMLVSRRPIWWVLHTLSFGVVHLMLLFWLAVRPYGEERLLHFTLVGLFWLLFVGYEVLIDRKKQWKGAYDFTGYATPILLLIGIGMIEEFHQTWMAGLLIGVSCLCYGWVAWQKQQNNESSYVNRLLRWDLSFWVLGALALTQFCSEAWLVVAWTLWGLWAIKWGLVRQKEHHLLFGTLQFLFVLPLFLQETSLIWSDTELVQQLWDLGLLAIFGGSLYLSATWMEKKGINCWKWGADIYHVAWAVVIMIFSSRKLVHGFDYAISIEPDPFISDLLHYFQMEFLGLLWLGLAILYCLYARRKQLLFFHGWTWMLAGLGIVNLLTQLIEMLEPSMYTPVLNVRTSIVVISLLLLYSLYRNQSEYRFTKLRPWVSKVLAASMILVLFEWLTIEVIDYFRIQALEKGANLAQLQYWENQTLSIAWIMFSIGLTWLNGKVQSRGLTVATWLVLAWSGVYTAVVSVSMASIEQFAPIFNARLLSFLLLSIAILLQIWYQHRWIHWFKNQSYAIYSFIFAIVIVLFELVTVEVSNTFSRLISLVPTNEVDRLVQLENMSRIAISIAWLIFACLLLWAGIWRKLQGLRLAAFGLMALAICKIFIFDLSFLNTLYRTLSLIVLGVILLGISYLYQKKKHWFV